MKITVVGTGYVGLVTGACLSEVGNTVTCVDIDEKKVKTLSQGQVPFYEPGLDVVVKRNIDAGRLKFTNDITSQDAQSEIYFIAVGTPPNEDGSADLSNVLAVAADIGQVINDDAIVMTKSTVPIGTSDKVKSILQDQIKSRKKDISFHVASNPEFLKEGAAVEDFMRPDRVIVGTESDFVKEKMTELYEPFMRTHSRMIFTGRLEAEMIKYAANSMLATKISFMNEISNICEKFGIDVESVRKGIGSDPRIGYSFIYPGVGYGGSCFPKDVRALIHMADSQNFDAMLLKAVEDRNSKQKNIIFEKIYHYFEGKLENRKIAIWGLSFKPETDDVRESAALPLIARLVEHGAIVSAYDPVASQNALKKLQRDGINCENINITKNQYDALKDADALALITEWMPFRKPDFTHMKSLLKQHVIFDGRNQYEPENMNRLGFVYRGIGRRGEAN